MERTIYKGVLQEVLARHDEIWESFSLTRKDRFGNEILVVYIVPTVLSLANATRLTLNDLSTEFPLAGDATGGAPSAAIAPSQDPVRIVLVNAIPRHQDGSVDESSLKAIPVLDADLIANWSKTIRSIECVESVAVFNVLRHRKAGYFHRADVFHSMDWFSEQADFPPDKKSSKAVQRIDASEMKVSSALAEVQATGQLFDDCLDSKYSLNLANTLYRAVEISPGKGIQYIDQAGNKSFQTYPQLLKLAQTVLAGLQAQGVKTGDKVLLQCADNQAFLAVFWACILGAMIPVPMPVAPSYTKDNVVVQKLLNVWQVFECPVIVCSDSLVNAFSHLFKETDLSEQKVLYFKQLSHNDSAAVATMVTDVAPDVLALLLLTSGSTGTPKAVMHTHQTLINRSAATSALNQFNPADVSLNWMPLDHVGGVVMFHLRDVYNACSQVQVATSWILEQPLRWLDTIDSERASITWAPNFAFALVNDHAKEISQRSWDLSCMRFILNAGEAVVARTASHFLKLLEKDKLPPDSMKPAWGMSETASAVTFSHNFTAETRADSDGAVEVGGPIPNTSLRIVNAENRLLHEGEKGNLQIKGASVTPGYYLNPEANQQAFTDDGWFDTGDAGVLNNGCLTITARVKDEIIINGVNHPAAELETIVESIAGVEVSFTAACAVRRKGSDTDSLAIFFCPSDDNIEPDAKLLTKIQEVVSSSAGVRPDFIIPLSRSQIPKTNIGKIQRGLLKQKFEQGEFDENIKQSERMLGTNVIPDWFYNKTWYPKTLFSLTPSTVGTLAGSNQYLVFCDSAGFGRALCEKLNQSGSRVVTVSIADKYDCLDKNTFTINPSHESDYLKLMQALHQFDFFPDVIVHCWTYAEVVDIAQVDDFMPLHQQGIYSLVNLVQSLHRVNAMERNTQLFVIGADVQQCLRERTFLNAHATIMGLLKTLDCELVWLSARHIDFALFKTAKELTKQVDALIEEILSKSRDDEIVYRDGLRYGWHLLPQTFAEDGFSSCPVKPGGIVLITGGLGSVGSILAKFLLRQFDAKLVLLGRTTLPEREKWPELANRQDKLSELVTRYLEIEALGGDFVYSVADVSDTDALQEVVNRAEQRWNQKLNGVFHLAVGDDIGSQSAVDEGIGSYEKVFAAKVYGSLAIADLVSQRGNAFMVSFGSVIGVFGEAGYAAYAAAHTFLNQLTQYYNYRNPGRFYQLDWSAWENIPEYAIAYFQTIGYSLISAEVGMDCLLAGVCSNQANLIVGLDADNWSIRKNLAFESQPLQRIMACFTTNDANTDIKSSIEANLVHDMFDVQAEFELLRLEQLPETAEGKPDIPALQAMFDSTFSEDNDKPATAIEREISAFWCDVLKVSEVGVNSSFFQLGGNSLNATQLISRLKQTYGIFLEIRDLFDAPTISKLSVLIGNRLEATEVPKQENWDSDSKADRQDLDSLSAQELLANFDQLSEEQVTELLNNMQDEAK